ncbi:MAG: 2-dehydropantoate 2-reductase [Xanthomonadaceae bacterium]|jgi:2-dehydropantoate 2-reductase|nr:2-dehydropantoate 2-reductase [Xanthomonadaceae bacterium]
MRILVLGAGGTGGYFGGRLVQSGADVVFLARPPRAGQLREQGLRLRSPLGDAHLEVTAVTTQTLPAEVAKQRFDLVLLSCKAYDLDSAIEAIAPAVGEETAVLPVLNGLRHYPVLDERFGQDRILGGLCFISASKGPNGEIVHMGKAASITFGERHGDPDSMRTAAFASVCEHANIDHLRSMRIVQQQWEKYTFLTTLAAATCLMRASVGQIVDDNDGLDFMRSLYRECLSVAEASGEPITADAQAGALEILTRKCSPMTASMLRDIEAGQPIEAEQIVGDMHYRARAAGLPVPLLTIAECHLRAYQRVRADRQRKPS